jgi:hypothetical protein
MSNDYIPGSDEFRRACELVGKFIFYWSTLEVELNRSIGKLLKLDMLAEAITTANLQARDKISIVQTCLDRAAQDPVLRASCKTLMTKITNLSKDRNRVAHNMFAPHQNGGVSFYITQAKGTLRLPEVVWSDAQCEAKFNALHEAQEELAAAVLLVSRGPINALLQGFLGAQRATAHDEPDLSRI